MEEQRKHSNFVLFSRKSQSSTHPAIVNDIITQTTTQKQQQDTKSNKKKWIPTMTTESETPASTGGTTESATAMNNNASEMETPAAPVTPAASGTPALAGTTASQESDAAAALASMNSTNIDNKDDDEGDKAGTTKNDVVESEKKDGDETGNNNDGVIESDSKSGNKTEELDTNNNNGGDEEKTKEWKCIRVKFRGKSYTVFDKDDEDNEDGDLDEDDDEEEENSSREDEKELNKFIEQGFYDEGTSNILQLHSRCCAENHCKFPDTVDPTAADERRCILCGLGGHDGCMWKIYRDLEGVSKECICLVCVENCNLLEAKNMKGVVHGDEKLKLLCEEYQENVNCELILFDTMAEFKKAVRKEIYHTPAEEEDEDEYKPDEESSEYDDLDGSEYEERELSSASETEEPKSTRRGSGKHIWFSTHCIFYVLYFVHREKLTLLFAP